MVRINPPPLPSVAPLAERYELWKSLEEHDVNKRGEAYTGHIAGRREWQFLKVGIASKEKIWSAKVVTYLKPMRSRRKGETVKDWRSSQAVACNERGIMNVGDPRASKGRVRTVEPLQTGRHQMSEGESDLRIVLGGRESRPRGKGEDSNA